MDKAEQLARNLHSKYNELAIKTGWKVQTCCETPWECLPTANQQVMLGMAEYVLSLLSQPDDKESHNSVGMTAETEKSLRQYLWLSHGHQGLYGDDGEMQCGECGKFGAMDYKRDPVEELIACAIKAREEVNLKALSSKVGVGWGREKLIEIIKKNLNWDYDTIHLDDNHYWSIPELADAILLKMGGEAQ